MNDLMKIYEILKVIRENRSGSSKFIFILNSGENYPFVYDFLQLEILPQLRGKIQQISIQTIQNSSAFRFYDKEQNQLLFKRFQNNFSKEELELELNDYSETATIELYIKHEKMNFFEVSIFVGVENIDLECLQQNNVFIYINCGGNPIHVQTNQSLIVQTSQNVKQQTILKKILEIYLRINAEQEYIQFLQNNSLNQFLDIVRDIKQIKDFVVSFVGHIQDILQTQFKIQSPQNTKFGFLSETFNAVFQDFIKLCQTQVESIENDAISKFIKKKGYQPQEINFSQDLFFTFIQPILQKNQFKVQQLLNIFCKSFQEQINSFCKIQNSPLLFQKLMHRCNHFILKQKSQQEKILSLLIQSQIDFFYSTKDLFCTQDLIKYEALFQDVPPVPKQNIMLYYNACKIKSACQNYIKQLIVSFQNMIPRAIGSFFIKQFQTPFQEFLFKYLHNHYKIKNQFIQNIFSFSEFNKRPKSTSIKDRRSISLTSSFQLLPDQVFTTNSSTPKNQEKTSGVFSLQNQVYFINQQNLLFLPDEVLREIIRQGLSPKQRIQVWSHFYTQKYKTKLSKESYQKMFLEALPVQDWDQQIYKDLLRTSIDPQNNAKSFHDFNQVNFSRKSILQQEMILDLQQKKLFQLENEFYRQNPKELFIKKSLFNVLKTFAFQHKQLGYIQGMNYIALVIFMTFFNQSDGIQKIEEKTFWILNIIYIGKSIFFKLDWKQTLDPEFPSIYEIVNQLEDSLKQQDQALYAHMSSYPELDFKLLFVDSILTLMTQKMSLELSQYVIDSFLLEGEKSLIQFLVCMMKCQRETIIALIDSYQLKTYLRDDIYLVFSNKINQQKLLYFFQKQTLT